MSVSSISCWALDCNNYTSQVSLVLKTEKSGVKKAKGERRKAERREGSGGQRSREGKLQTGVTSTEWIHDAWGKEVKHRDCSRGPSSTLRLPSPLEHSKCQSKATQDGPHKRVGVLSARVN